MILSIDTFRQLPGANRHLRAAAYTWILGSLPRLCRSTPTQSLKVFVVWWLVQVLCSSVHVSFVGFFNLPCHQWASQDHGFWHRKCYQHRLYPNLRRLHRCKGVISSPQFKIFCRFFAMLNRDSGQLPFERFHDEMLKPQWVQWMIKGLSFSNFMQLLKFPASKAQLEWDWGTKRGANQKQTNPTHYTFNSPQKINMHLYLYIYIGNLNSQNSILRVFI